MTQEKPWWIDNEYWWPYDPELGHQAKHVDMIAEATRRGIQQGKREAWEDARMVAWRKKEELSAKLDKITDGWTRVILLAADTGLDMALDVIDAKLASLANDKV